MYHYLGKVKKYRYLLFYDNDLNDNLNDSFLALFKKLGIFIYLIERSKRDKVESIRTEMNVVTEVGVQNVIHKTIPYSTLLKKISTAAISLSRFYIRYYTSMQRNMELILLLILMGNQLLDSMLNLLC